MKFSESLGPNDLALWLFQEIGNDYRDDIEKLKGSYFTKTVRHTPRISYLYDI